MIIKEKDNTSDNRPNDKGMTQLLFSSLKMHWMADLDFKKKEIYLHRFVEKKFLNDPQCANDIVKYVISMITA